jgi:AcrR family transcriptional regulator
MKKKRKKMEAVFKEKVKKMNFDEIKTKMLVLEAASEVFSRYGKERTTVKMIAEKAEVPASVILQYFKDIDELYSELLWYLWHIGKARYDSSKYNQEDFRD